MSEPIRLSLAGRGRVGLLTPGNVRAAFFRFTAANRLTGAELHAFDLPGQRSPGLTSTPLARLHRRGTGPRGRPGRPSDLRRRRAPGDEAGPDPPYLTAFEVRAVERQMNRLLL